MTEPVSNETAATVVSGGASGEGRRKRFAASGRTFKAVAIVLLLIALVVGGWFLYQKFLVFHPTTALSKTDIQHIPFNDYDGMTQEEARYVLQKDTGHSLQDLKTKPIDRDFLPNFDVAYAAARGYARLGMPKRALDSYRLADGMATNDAYDFHIHYGFYALSQQDAKDAKQQAQKATDAISKSHDSTDNLDGAKRQVGTLESAIQQEQS